MHNACVDKLDYLKPKLAIWIKTKLCDTVLIWREAFFYDIVYTGDFSLGGVRDANLADQFV